MVLSRKKLKKQQQQLLQQANPAPSDESPLPSEKRPLPPSHLSDVDASEEPCLDGTAIDPSEIERYHACLDKVLRGDSAPQRRAKKKNRTERDLAPGDAMAEQQQEEHASAPSVEDHGSVDSEPKKTKKDKRKKDRERNPLKKGDDFSLELASSEHVYTTTSNGADESMEHIEEKPTALSVKDNDSADTKTVYVGGIPFYSSEDDIMNFFRDCGTISGAVYKTFPDTGKFRGITLITFKTEGGAQRALAMDGASMGSCFLKIRPCASTPKEAIKPAYKEPPKKTEGYTRAYIGNLSWDVSEEDIRSLFADCKIDAIRFSLNKTTGEFQGFGHVDFTDDESLERALKLNQHIVLGRPIKIAYAVTKSKSEQQTQNISKKSKARNGKKKASINAQP